MEETTSSTWERMSSSVCCDAASCVYSCSYILLNSITLPDCCGLPKSGSPEVRSRKSGSPKSAEVRSPEVGSPKSEVRSPEASAERSEVRSVSEVRK